MKLKDDYAPLRRGTLATIRQASLSGVANRYIDLRMAPQSGEKIPDGGVLEQDATTTAVDLDQLFNTFDPATRKALSGVIRGSAAQIKGKGKQFNEGIAYLNPSLAASSRLFRELNRDTPLLERFIVSSSQLVTDIADRHDDLAGLVDELATTTTAIGNQKEALAESIGRLPGFQRRANTTFVNLRAALDDLDPLVDESKPVAKKLRPFLAELRPLARDARPTLNDLSQIVKRPGAANDLIELTSLQVPLRDVTTRKFEANGKQRDGAFKASPGRAQGQHARVRVLPPLHARPARLVRRLQPLRHLRRARRRLARRHPRERVRAHGRGRRRPVRGDPARAARPGARGDARAAPEQPLPGRRRAQDRRRLRALQADPRLPLRPVAGAPGQ